MSPNLNWALSQDISLTLCANQSLQHLPASALYRSFRSFCQTCQDCLGSMSCYCCDCMVPPLGMPSLLCYELSLCLAFRFTSCRSLKMFLFPRSFRAELA